jgi:S-DNA-T family DNA segregation ATPase FtsK/SpoIIIE
VRAYTGLLPELRRSKQGVLLNPDIDVDGDLVGVRLRAPVESVALRGRGFLAYSGTAELAQFARVPVS